MRSEIYKASSVCLYQMISSNNLKGLSTCVLSLITCQLWESLNILEYGGSSTDRSVQPPSQLGEHSWITM
ncbi:hypothetical protein AV530_016999 [Patagioenas fasciata monilis]|uniref:Uncharacterized protein n=1 Tax=Patagioenas fasciata monilis TaxID=372326 RepID=A0A1V4J4C0_PATFA|nr:hypothetical protein AV530_016999 [Patagioenas fasciata monilis]